MVEMAASVKVLDSYGRLNLKCDQAIAKSCLNNYGDTHGHTFLVLKTFPSRVIHVMEKEQRFCRWVIRYDLPVVQSIIIAGPEPELFSMYSSMSDGTLYVTKCAGKLSIDAAKKDDIFEDLLNAAQKAEEQSKPSVKFIDVKSTDRLLHIPHLNNFVVFNGIMITVQYNMEGILVQGYAVDSDHKIKNKEPYHLLYLPVICSKDQNGFAELINIMIATEYSQSSEKWVDSNVLWLESELYGCLASSVPGSEGSNCLLLLSIPNGDVYCCNIPNLDQIASIPIQSTILYQLQQIPLRLLGIDLNKHDSSSVKGGINTLVLIGSAGKVVLITTDSSTKTLVFNDFQVPAPVKCVDYSPEHLLLVHSTERDLYTTRLKNISDHLSGKTGQMIKSKSHRYCNIIAMSVQPEQDSATQTLKLIAFTLRGCLQQMEIHLQPPDSDGDHLLDARVASHHIRDLLVQIDTIAKQLESTKLSSQACDSVLKQLAIANLLSSHHSRTSTAAEPRGQPDTPLIMCATNLDICEYGQHVQYRVVVTLTVLGNYTFSQGWSMKCSLQGSDKSENRSRNTVTKVATLIPLTSGSSQKMNIDIDADLVNSLPITVSTALVYNVRTHLVSMDCQNLFKQHQVICLPVVSNVLDLIHFLRPSLSFRPNTAIMTSELSQNVVYKIAAQKPSFASQLSAVNCQPSAGVIGSSTVAIKLPSSYMELVYHQKLLVGGKPSLSMFKPLFADNRRLHSWCDSQQPVLKMVSPGNREITMSVSLSDMASGTYELTLQSTSIALAAHIHRVLSQRFQTMEASSGSDTQVHLPNRAVLKNYAKDLEAIKASAISLSEKDPEKTKTGDISNLYQRLRRFQWHC